MAPAMEMIQKTDKENFPLESRYQKGVKHLCDNGISKVPNKYIFPITERPNNNNAANDEPSYAYETELNLKLPVIDFAELQGPNRHEVLKSLAYACENYGFFQLVNHGIQSDVTRSMVDVGRKFFELPFEEREKYMSTDLTSTVRYGTSFNQTKDGVFCWRDFLKLVCNSPLSNVLPHWPSSPHNFTKTAATYVNETKFLFLMLVKAIIDSLGLTDTKDKAEDKDNDILQEFRDGSQIMVVNCYPQCPEPDLTLGMPPHSDYGFLTLLFEDQVQGLQIQHQQKWLTIETIPNSFVVNVGDHLEIFSNGRYKSVLHRVIVNSSRCRISVASLHSQPFETMIRPWPKLINETNPKRYQDTNFAAFLHYLSSCESKKKNFLESRKLIDLKDLDPSRIS